MSEPEGRGGAWTEERGTSDEGRQHSEGGMGRWVGPRRRAGRHSVRLRLTLLYVGLFLASAAGLLAMTYVLVEQQLPRITTNGGMMAISGGSRDLGTGAPLLQTVAVRVGQDTLDQLLIESGIALGIMAVASVGLGWLMAGRVLSPLRTITATARRISARSLHQRIAMTGPDDELKELGDTFDQLLGRLDASFRAQRQFVANASHELRTPLARQRTLLEVALRDRRGHRAPRCARPASGRWQRASSRNGSSPRCSRWPAANAAWTGSSGSTWARSPADALAAQREEARRRAG